MKNKLIYSALCSAGLFLGLAASAHADIITTTLPEFSDPNYYDFTSTFPPATPVTIDTFNFTIPALESIGSATISGTFGNVDYNNTTALVQLFLDNILVASCSDTSNACFTGAADGNPVSWSYTFSDAQLALLNLNSGTATLSDVQTAFGTVNVGPTTLDITAVPLPASWLLWLSGGLAVFMRRNRKSLPGMLALLVAPSAGFAQEVNWLATTTPVQATISGGPWSLEQNGTLPFTAQTGVYDAGITYCSGGAQYFNPAGSAGNTFSPYYTPFITGSGNNLQGYFDYRPRNINEATVAAKSTDGGLTWTFLQMAEGLTSACPTSDVNSSGNDSGKGHPYVLSFAGTSWLYLTNRATGHIDSDGLLVNRIPSPSKVKPLGTLALNTGLPTYTYIQPTAANTITRWDFDNDANVTQKLGSTSGPYGLTSTTYKTNNSPAPSIGSGTAIPLGMTNTWTYTYSTTQSQVGSAGSGSDITNTAGSSEDTGAGSNSWRIRGPANVYSTTPGLNDGWNTAAPQLAQGVDSVNGSQGVEFDVSTAGQTGIVLQFDWYTTAQGIRNLQVQYTSDNTAASPVWNNVGPLQVAPAGGGYINQININFSALGVPAADVENNPNFAVRMMAAYDPDYFLLNGVNTYTAATLTNGLPVPYNNNSGNWRFDEVNILNGGYAAVPPVAPSTVNTVGLINPDGILASVPGTYPRQILYVSKSLNADLTYPVSEQCGLPSPNATATTPNHDITLVRLATTLDGVHFTDQGTVNGLNDPTTVSPTAIRYAAGNGSLLKLPNGNWGLFFGAGNCLDGDSDAFHVIAYAESTDLINWTVINGINNPIASVLPVSTYNGQVIPTVPATAPVIGATQSWFGGRVYAPNAVINDSGSVNLIFAGYNQGYSTDLTSYRNIGQVVLSSGGVALQ